MDLANNLGVGDFSAAVGWDLIIGNGEEGVGAFNAFAFIGTSSNALAKAPQFVCIGGVPGSGEGGRLRSWRHLRKLPVFSSRTDAALLMVQAEEAQWVMKADGYL